MGVATILEARRLRALAFGAGKRESVRRAREEPIGPALPATFLREHGDVRLYVDSAAAGSA
jgi:glucosamine-6-phosphate deaminase